MAKGGNKTLVIVLSIIAGVILLLWLIFKWFAPEPYKYDWYTYWSTESDQPYGLLVAHKLLDELSEDGVDDIKEDLVRELPIDDESNSAYIFVGEHMYLDSADIDHMLKYLRAGNTALIASNYIPYQLLDNLNEHYEIYLDDFSTSSAYSEIQDSAVQVNFTHPELKKDTSYSFRYRYQMYYPYYNWRYIHEDIIYDTSITYAELGNLDDQHMNFVKIDVGDGTLLLHSNPILFCNYYTTENDGFEYFNGVVTHLEEGPVYWDEASKMPSMDFGGNGGINIGEGPFRYILSQPPLKYALYVILAMALLYVLFRAKRRQRIIPIRHPNSNTSLDFIRTVGSLYYLQRNHRKLSMDQMALFLSNVRDRYGLATKEIDKQFVARLAQRAKLSKQEVQVIFDKYQVVKTNEQISEELMVEFYQVLQHFYINAK